MNRAKLSKKFYDLALEIIEDGNYDVVTEGDYLASDFAVAATNIFKNLLTWDSVKGGWLIKKQPVSVFTMGFNWKVSNINPCFVSCSDENKTGVARSEAYIFTKVTDSIDRDQAETLLDMMNDAWYLAAEHDEED